MEIRREQIGDEVNQISDWLRLGVNKYGAEITQMRGGGVEIRSE